MVPCGNSDPKKPALFILQLFSLSLFFPPFVNSFLSTWPLILRENFFHREKRNFTYVSRNLLLISPITTCTVVQHNFAFNRSQPHTCMMKVRSIGIFVNEKRSNHHQHYCTHPFFAFFFIMTREKIIIWYNIQFSEHYRASLGKFGNRF